MRCRASLLVALALVVVVAAVVPAAGGSPRVGSSFYVVDPDPRMCPSPLCGGYWVSIANHSRTRCSDGALRARCYVARAVGENRRPLDAAVPAGSLTRAEMEQWPFDGLGDLGVLVVVRVYAPVGRAAPAGRYFRLVDTGIRCVRAPCFSVRASQLNRTARATVSGVDVGAAPVGARERVGAALSSKQGLLARGRIAPTPDGGRVFLATRFFLASER